MSELIQSHKDIRLLNRAIREQWPTAPEMREKAVAELAKLCRSRNPELKLRAIDLLRKIDAHNFAMAKAAIPTLHLHQHRHGDDSSTTQEEVTVDERRSAIARRIESLERIGGNF